jgi:hypothetical protein
VSGTGGGLVGANTGTVSNSFWDTTTSGKGTSAGGTGMATADMQTQANFTSATSANGSVNPAWDFASTWVMYDGHTSPLLRSFMTPLTVTANDATKIYDKQAFSGGNGVTPTPNGNLLGTASYSGTSQGATNAGSYTITPGGLYSNQQGYIISYANGTLTINPATLTVTADAASRLYGAANPSLSGSVTGFVNNDTLANATGGSETFSTAAISTSNVGSYDITGAGLTANNGNYVFAQAPGNATALTVTSEVTNAIAAILSMLSTPPGSSQSSVSTSDGGTATPADNDKTDIVVDTSLMSGGVVLPVQIVDGGVKMPASFNVER